MFQGFRHSGQSGLEAFEKHLDLGILFPELGWDFESTYALLTRVYISTKNFGRNGPSTNQNHDDNMCRFQYVHNDACGHRTIQILSYCARTAWSGGDSDILQPCKEDIYASHFTDLCVQELFPYIWESKTNFSREFEAEYT